MAVTQPTPPPATVPAGTVTVGTPSPIGDLVGQILDLVNGSRGQDTNRGNTAAGMADPFASQRGQYQELLATAMKNPTPFENKTYDYGTYTESPGYKFARDQGLEGVNRAGNAMFGSTRSGNTAVELEKFATGFAAQDYDKWMDQNIRREQIFNSEQDAQRSAGLTGRNIDVNALLQASGANTGNPAAAAQSYLTGTAANDKTLGGGLQGIDGLLSMLGGPSGIGNLLSQGGSAISSLLTGIFGGGGMDFSKLNLGSGDLTSFLTSIGIDPNAMSQFGVDPSTIPESFNGILNAGLVQPSGSIDLSGNTMGTPDASTGSLLESLGIG